MDITLQQVVAGAKALKVAAAIAAGIFLGGFSASVYVHSFASQKTVEEHETRIKVLEEMGRRHEQNEQMILEQLIELARRVGARVTVR